MNYEIIINKYQKVLAEIDQEWHRIARQYNFECRKCSECCQQPVPVSRPIEALVLLQHFKRLNKLKQREILQRAHKYKYEAKCCGYTKYPELLMFNAQFVLSQMIRDLQGILCPLLSGSLCELYDARPVACRAYTCFDDFEWKSFYYKISKIESFLPFDILDWKMVSIADVLLLSKIK